MAFNNYLEDENDKPYFTTNSLAYYYDKMEGFAKAVEGSAKALNLTKEEIEQRIALRLAEWDENLESFDGSVEKLLSEWVDDGTLTHVIDSTLIDQRLAPVTALLADKLGKGQVTISDIDKNKGLLDQTFLSDSLKQQIAGTAPINAIPADNSITTEKFVDKSVNRAKLNNQFSLVGSIPAGVDLKTVVDEGIYFGQPNANYINAPIDLAVGRFFNLKVEPLSEAWATQTIVDFTNPGRSWRRTVHRTNISGVNNPWEYGASLLDNSVSRIKLGENFYNNGTIATNTDINTIVKAGSYLGLAANTYVNVPPELTGKSFVMNVYVGGLINSFIVQEITEHNNPNHLFRRMNTNAANPGTWGKFSASSGNTGKPLAGKTIVQFGDSIYGNKRPPLDISTALANKTGATVHNLGIGGSRMSQHQQFWDATSMYRLADAVATGNYTLQNELISEYDAGRLPNLPYYVKSTLQLMQTINWNNVYAITIAHGTNDLTADSLLDSETNLLDTTTYGGALRYSLKKILAAYPHIKVMVVSPMYRFWAQSASPYDFIEDSDTSTYAGGKLTEFVVKAEQVSKEEKTHFIDAYNHFGIGKSNRHYYFDDLTGSGGTHHNDAGAKYIGEKLASEIVSRV